MRKRFLKLIKFPIMVVFGDNIPRDADKLDTRALFGSAACSGVTRSTSMAAMPKFWIFRAWAYPEIHTMCLADTNVNQVAAQMSLWLKNQGLDN